MKCVDVFSPCLAFESASISVESQETYRYINGEYCRIILFEIAHGHLKCGLMSRIQIHKHTHVRVLLVSNRRLSHQLVIYSDLMRPDMFNKHERARKENFVEASRIRDKREISAESGKIGRLCAAEDCEFFRRAGLKIRQVLRNDTNKHVHRK